SSVTSRVWHLAGTSPPTSFWSRTSSPRRPRPKPRRSGWCSPTDDRNVARDAGLLPPAARRPPSIGSPVPLALTPAGESVHSKRPLQEVTFEFQPVLRHFLLRRHVGDPAQWQHAVRTTGSHEGGRQPKGVGCHHVVIDETVDQQQGALQVGGVTDERA